MFVLSLLLCLFLLWHLAEVNCEFSLSCNSYFWVSTVFLYPQLFRHFLGNPQYRKRINLKGWELRTKQPSSIFCHECIHSASLEFYGNIIKAVQYSCSCWYSAKYYSRILQVELCCHIHLTQSKFCCSFCSNVCSDREGSSGTSKPACKEKNCPKEPFRTVNIITDIETKEMRTRESARSGMSNGFYYSILLPRCSFFCMHFLEDVNMRIIHTPSKQE